MKRSQHLTLFSVFVFLMFEVWTSLAIASDAKLFLNEGESLKNRLEDVSNKGVERLTSYKTKILSNNNYRIEASRLSKSKVDICPHGYILDGPAHNALLSPSTVAVQHQ